MQRRSPALLLGATFLAAVACEKIDETPVEYYTPPVDGGAVPPGSGGSTEPASGGASSGGITGSGGSSGSGGSGAGTSGGASGSGGSSAGGAGGGTDADAGAPDAGPVAIPDPTPTGCVTDVTAGKRTVPCDGLTFDISVPSRCIGTQCGLIFDVHGGTMSGPMEDKNTRLAALGEKYGYVVVDPNAFGGLWSAGVDDPKVYSFMHAMQDAFHTDPKRLHITGLSQGGYMSWRFLCAHTDEIASAAPAASAGAAKISVEIGCTFTGTDVPKGEIDILYMHGTKDGLVDYQNAVVLRDAIVKYWGLGAPETVSEDSTYRRHRYTTKTGRVFEFIDHDYASPSTWGLPPLVGVAIQGHCFPGSPDQTVTLPGQLMSFGCTPPNSFDWGEEVMKFFIAHPKR